jgi:replicative DNA helicase
LKRGQESKNEPSLSDLRDSGQIEEAADIVMFAHRPEYYGIDTFEDGNSAIGKAEIIISKGRNIGLARFRLNFISHLTKFTNETDTFTNIKNDDFIF